MTRAEMAAFFAKRQNHWNAHDALSLASGHADSGSVQSPMYGTLSGRDAIEDAYASLFTAFPDWRFTGDELLIDGNRVAQVFGAEATHVGEFMGLSGTNRRFRIQGVRLYEMADGLIQSERRLYDFTGLLIQVGVLRSKPGRAS
jgi:predicted ester cyclase